MARRVLHAAPTMQPPNQPGAPGPASVPQYGTQPADVDAAFDAMRVEPSRVERVKDYVQPKLRAGRAYLEEHRAMTALVGFGVGYLVGRLLRRS